MRQKILKAGKIMSHGGGTQERNCYIKVSLVSRTLQNFIGKASVIPLTVGETSSK